MASPAGIVRNWRGGDFCRPYESGSEIGNLVRLQLKMEFVSDKGDELRVRGSPIR